MPKYPQPKGISEDKEENDKPRGSFLTEKMEAKPCQWPKEESQEDK